MDRQKMYDITVEHLLIQGVPSLHEDVGCCYRNEQGYKCAIGVHIPDIYYYPFMEGVSIDYLGIDHLESHTVNHLHRDYSESKSSTCTSPTEHFDTTFADALFRTLFKLWGVESSEDILFLNDLQEIHDNQTPCEWLESYHELGMEHGLDISIINRCARKTFGFTLQYSVTEQMWEVGRFVDNQWHTKYSYDNKNVALNAVSELNKTSDIFDGYRRY